MRKTIMAGCLILMTAILHAKDIQVSFGFATFKLPLSEVNAVYHYDFLNMQPLIGAETSLIKIANLTSTFGGVLDARAEGTPFLGLDYKFDKDFFHAGIRFGGYYGYDFRREEHRAGLKSSISLW